MLNQTQAPNYYDYIIVGAGSAGCVLANRLSACGKYSVCLIEAGPKDSNPLIKIPAGVATLIQWGKYNWKFDSQAEPSLSGRSVYCPRGKTLGGSSAINAMVYIRGQKEDYQRWIQNGVSGWGYEDLLPYFKRTMAQQTLAESGSPQTPYSTEYHGYKGELAVSDISKPQTFSQDFITAAQQTGYSLNSDFNGAEQEGIGLYQATIKNGERHSCAHAFLHPLLEAYATRKNLTVLTGKKTARVILEQGVAKGITLVDGCTIQANREVILSAGALQSPQLLMLSGIGDKSELNKHDITCLIDSPEVGKNLQEHVDIVVVNRAKAKKIKTAAMSFSPTILWRGCKEAWQFFRYKKGLFSSNLIEAGGFIKSSPDKKTADLQLMLTPALFNDHGRDWKFMMGWGFSIHATLLRPQSRGKVSLKDNNPNSDPNIQLNLLSAAEDYQPLISGIKKIREMTLSPALQSYQLEEVFPGKNVNTDLALKKFIHDKANHVYHPVGSCRMGSDQSSVVDLEMKVRGTKNLRVVDASVFPDQISGNTNATVVAMADKISINILKD